MDGEPINGNGIDPEGSLSTQPKIEQTSSTTLNMQALHERPAQWPDGTWRNPFGEVVDAPLDPDTVTLNNLSTRALAKHEGKYQNTLLGVAKDPNVESERPYLKITPEEIAASKRLVGLAKDRIGEAQAAEPLWADFQMKLAQRQNTLGPLNEEVNVVVDPSVTAVTIDSSSAMTIRVPENVRAVYIWTNIIRRLTGDVRDIENGVAQDRSAQQFGERVYQTQAFVKEMSDK